MYLSSKSTLGIRLGTGCFYAKSLSTQAATLKVDGIDNETWANARSFREVPGPTRYELMRGFMPGGTYYKKSFMDFLREARKQYGDIYRVPGTFGKEDVLMIFNVDDFQKIYRADGVWPARPVAESFQYYRKKYQAKIYEKAEGLLSSQGQKWAEFRTAVNPVLMQPRNTRSYVIPMQEVNTEFLQRIREVRDPVTYEVPDDFVDDINRLAFESVSVVAVNRQFGLLRSNRDRKDAKELFSNIQTFLSLFYDLDFQPSLWKYVWTPTFARYKKCLDATFETISVYVADALKQLEDEKRNNIVNPEQSVLEQLVKIDSSVAIIMAMDLFIAGVDTTTTTLTGILLEVAKNPEKQTKLRAEVRQYLPEKDSTFTIESLKNLPYLRACIKEGIRMHPLGSGNARYAGEDLVLCGYQVPKGTALLLNSNLMLRDEKYFANANKFIPERWLREGISENEIVPFSYLPFGFGPRMCVGRRIVDLELEVTLARLVRNFYMEFNYPIENAFKSHFINTPAIPLKFKFIEVEN